MTSDFINKLEAESIAAEHLSKNRKYKFKVIRNKTVEHSFGFVIFYENLSISKVNNNDLPLGQGPLIVMKKTKKIIEVGSMPLQTVIKNIEDGLELQK